MKNKDVKKIVSDLKTFDIDELNTLIKYYHINANLASKDVLIELASELYMRSYKKGSIPNIFDAIEENNVELVQEMINTPGFDINALNRFAYTPLMYAISRKVNGIVELLIDGGADLNYQNTISGNNTALMLAIFNNNVKAADLLIFNRANLNLQDQHGNTALMRALVRNYNIIAKLLVFRGADLYLQNRHGNTALMFADKDKNTEFLSWIIEQDIKIPSQIQKKLPYYTELKILALRQEIQELKKVLSREEFELLETNPACISKDIEELEKCKEIGEEMILYRPGGEEMKKLREKYKTHPYFS